MDAINVQPTLTPSAEPYITFADIFEDDESETAIAAGSQNEFEAIASLQDLLPPTQPPAFAKERIMAHLQEPIVAIFVPSVTTDRR